MTASVPLDHELSDAELDLQAQRWAEQAESRSRQRAILEARKKEWRNAPPQAGGLKPFTDVWSDVEAQRRGAITENQFWEQVIRSIHEGFFDSNRDLSYFVNEKTRITSHTLKLIVGTNEADDDRLVIHAVVRSSWASIETLSEWAHCMRYETPIAWQAILPARAFPDLLEAGAHTQQATNSKAPSFEHLTKKVRIAAEVLWNAGLSEGASFDQQLQCVNNHMRKHKNGIMISPRTFQAVRKAVTTERRKSRSPQIASDCLKLP